MVSDFHEDAFGSKSLMGGTESGILVWAQLCQVLLQRVGKIKIPLKQEVY